MALCLGIDTGSTSEVGQGCPTGLGNSPQHRPEVTSGGITDPR